MTDLLYDLRKVSVLGGDSAGSICDLAGLDPSSAAPCDMTVTHLGSGGEDEGDWVVPANIPAFVVRNLLSKGECAAIIAATPSAGPGFMNEDDVAARYRGRTCTRLGSHDPSMSSLVERRLRDLLPLKLDGGELIGVSPRWRHVHYKGEQLGHQDYHIDGREPLPAAPMVGERKGLYRQSRLTCMVYLNTAGVDFEGGSTTFLDDGLKPRPGGEHRPVAGDCICFYQESYDNHRSLLLHEGSNVTRGNKRMMRTVVDYGGFSKADCQRCLWADNLDAQEAEMLAEVDRNLADATKGVPPRVTARVAQVVAAALSVPSAKIVTENALPMDIAGAGAFEGCSFYPVCPALTTNNFFVRDFTNGLVGEREVAELAYSIGRYNERRSAMYTSELFAGSGSSDDTWSASNSSDGPTDQRRDIHMGIDIMGPTYTPVHAVCDGTIHAVGYNPAALDYGHVIVTKHMANGITFWALTGHLSGKSIEGKVAGDEVKRGQLLGWFGDTDENGGWPPHVHFQLSLIEPPTHDMPGVVSTAQHAQALKDYPDPRWVMGPVFPGTGLFESTKR